MRKSRGLGVAWHCSLQQCFWWLGLAQGTPRACASSFCSPKPRATLFQWLAPWALAQLPFWRFFAHFGQPACLPSDFLAPRDGWALNCGAFAAAPAQSGHPKPKRARCGMGAKTLFSFKKSVEILMRNACPAHALTLAV